MVSRRKSRLERWFSLNQHRKRAGAGKLSDSGIVDYAALRQQTVEGDKAVFNFGAKRDVQQHLTNLRTEFAGKSELLYHHAKLIVLIRREFKVREHFNEFDTLWKNESDFLLTEMNLRWLVSAADTFADHAKDPVTRALALNTSLLFNTVKMQETERFLQMTETAEDDEERLKILQDDRTDLFDGTAAFVVGTDDTLRNMRWRMDEVSQIHPVGRILEEVFRRLQLEDTVFRRFKDRHRKDKTAWW